MIFFIDFSENYIVNWGKDGVLKDIEMFNNFRVVFIVSRILVLKFIVVYVIYECILYIRFNEDILNKIGLVSKLEDIINSV